MWNFSVLATTTLTMSSLYEPQSTRKLLIFNWKAFINSKKRLRVLAYMKRTLALPSRFSR